ncbi:antibiotic biosynthesis monooxygenase family protein [Arthrobacter sp. Z4-13]
MIHESATLTIKDGAASAFEAAVAEAVPLFQNAPGALSLRLDRSIENPREYTLTVAWATIEDHTIGFRSSAAFSKWRELVGPHFAEAPNVKHLEHIYLGF